MYEVLAVFFAAVLATLLGQVIKKALRPLATRASLARWPRRIVVVAMVLAPAILAVVLILALRPLFASFDLPVAFIDLSFRLATVLLIVRAVVHVVSVSLGPNSWMRTWETRFTFLIWAAI